MVQELVAVWGTVWGLLSKGLGGWGVSRTGILSRCWHWKEYEGGLGHKWWERCVRHPWAGFLGGKCLWNGGPKKGILEGGAVQRMGLWG